MRRSPARAWSPNASRCRGTKGFRTGGTIHFVINNQIGFTTAPVYSRSSPYCTDIALMVQAPIFHVNGDDPEAVVHCARIATEFRQLFHKDVVIDMFCYRRFGHNETRRADLHPAPDVPGDQGSSDDAAALCEEAGRRRHARRRPKPTRCWRPSTSGWTRNSTPPRRIAPTAPTGWTGAGPDLPTAPKGDRRGDTAVPLESLHEVGTRADHRAAKVSTCTRPSRASSRPRRKMFETGEGFDWATAEALAFGTLARRRLSRSASRARIPPRGTFSQRHAALVDQETEARYLPLQHVREGQAQFEVIDSLLSEEAVLGFEYGYSSAEPKALVLWEAQFGDFANGAQVIIDQFIASGEMKWLRMCGLVMLLPHGYEGQGPEHSSARLERYLQLCAQDNMQVAYCTTPANYFHVLRRQMHRPFRKPLILMTPKSLLRHKRCISFLADFGPGSSFHRVLRDQAEVVPGA